MRRLTMMALVIGLAAGACSGYKTGEKGDLNKDGQVNGKDLALLVGMISQGKYDLSGDLNGDGKVDDQDLAILKGIICQALGGKVNADEVCCITGSDGTTCCDKNFEGNFTDCQPPSLDCTKDADCSVLNCPSYCGPDLKCRCQGMCDTDEDCIALNCPAFCTDSHQCECKVPCTQDVDCGYIQHCPSVCGDKGYCVCGQSCYAEGQEYAGNPADLLCCDGLVPIEVLFYSGGQCVPVNRANLVCTHCGNGVCGAGENPCNCPQDCGECSAGDTRTFTCSDGNIVPWCTCTAGGHWDCIKSPEDQCQAKCHVAGEHFIDGSGAEPCCPGLTKADDCVPMDNNGQVSCECPNCPCVVCVASGDGVCGAGENVCTSPQDCPSPACKPDDTLPCHCNNHFGADPACFECTQDGKWVPIDYFADPCQCTTGPACAQSYVCDRSSGQCVVDCRLVNCGGANCNVCPPGENCDPNTGLCAKKCNPGDTLACTCNNNLAMDPPCFSCGSDGSWVPIDYIRDPCLCVSAEQCAQDYVCDGTGKCVLDCRMVNCGPGTNCDMCGAGQHCDSNTGLCVANCLGEGGKFEGTITDLCCQGLTAVFDLIADDTTGACIGPNCPCMICTRCGDGICGTGENRCNCPQDCIGFTGCGAASCVNVARGYWMSGDCPGIVTSDPNRYDIVQVQGSCALGFKGLMGQVLGVQGCIDHAQVFTSLGCSGTVNQFGASITISFVCPFANNDGTHTTCNVLLDDGLD